MGLPYSSILGNDARRQTGSGDRRPNPDGIDPSNQEHTMNKMMTLTSALLDLLKELEDTKVPLIVGGGY